MSKKQSDYEKYLAEKHSNFNTSDEILEQTIKEATSSSILSKDKIIAGEVNEVYKIVLKNNHKVVVRIARKDNPEFEQEKWAIDQCKKVGLPVPEVLLIKHVPQDNQVLSLCVQEKIEGDTLERGEIDYKNLDQQYLRKIINQAGELLSRIHTISTTNYGWLNEKGEGIYQTVREMVMEKVDQDEQLQKLAQETNFDTQLMKEVVKVMESNIKLYEGIKPKLCHGDYGPKHIMIKDDKIVGILDFGGVCSDSPIYDFAWWDYWFGDDIPVAWLKEGYTDKSLFDDTFDILLHYLRLYRGVGLLFWYNEEQYQPAIDRAKNKLLDDFKYFK